MSTNLPPESSEDRYTYLCPITYMVFRDPVVASDGFKYERAAIEAWFHARRWRRGILSPNTNLPLANLVLMRAAPAFLADLERFVAAHPEEERYPPTPAPACPRSSVDEIRKVLSDEETRVWYKRGRAHRAGRPEIQALQLMPVLFYSYPLNPTTFQPSGFADFRR